MNSTRGAGGRGRWFRWLSVLLMSLCVSLLLMFVSTSAQTQPAPPKALIEELKKTSCKNAAVVAKLYEQYEQRLGNEKPTASVTASVAERLAICLPEMLSVGCTANSRVQVTIGFAGESDRFAALRSVQAMNSMAFFARDVGRIADPELRALATKYNVTQAASELTARVFSMRSLVVTPDEDSKYRELLKKSKDELTSEERALIERIKPWDAPL